MQINVLESWIIVVNIKKLSVFIECIVVAIMLLSCSGDTQPNRTPIQGGIVNGTALMNTDDANYDEYQEPVNEYQSPEGELSSNNYADSDIMQRVRQLGGGEGEIEISLIWNT